MKLADIRKIRSLLSTAEACEAAYARYSQLGIINSRFLSEKEECLKEVEKIKSALDSIKDAETRQAVQLYASGKNWEQVHYALYKYHSLDSHGSTIRKKCERALEKIDI